MKKRTLSEKDLKDRLFWCVLILPAFLLCFTFIVIPIIDSIIKSFTDYKLVNLVQHRPGKWNSFANYIRLFSSGRIQKSIGITLVFVTAVTAITFLLGIALALILNTKIKGARFLRSIMMIPWVVPTVIGGMLWMWIYSSPYGLLRFFISILSGGKLSDFAILSNTKWALWGVVAAALWKQVPLMTLLLLAGLQNVPQDMLEAATIDGANGFEKIVHIIIPEVKSVIKVAVSMCIIENFKQYPLFATLTNGGPSRATTTLAVLSYDEAFAQFNYGSGAAVTTVWLLVMVFVIFIYNRLFEERKLRRK